jgi:hypothetical protein
MISSAFTRKVRMGTKVMEVMAGTNRYTVTASARDKKKSNQ